MKTTKTFLTWIDTETEWETPDGRFAIQKRPDKYYDLFDKGERVGTKRLSLKAAKALADEVQGREQFDCLTNPPKSVTSIGELEGDYDPPQEGDNQPLPVPEEAPSVERRTESKDYILVDSRGNEIPRKETLDEKAEWDRMCQERTAREAVEEVTKGTRLGVSPIWKQDVFLMGADHLRIGLWGQVLPVPFILGMLPKPERRKVRQALRSLGHRSLAACQAS